MKNNILAMPAAAAAIPKKPKAAAIRATTKNITAHRNMVSPFLEDAEHRKIHRLPARNVLFVLNCAIRLDTGDVVDRLSTSCTRKAAAMRLQEIPLLPR
jgi:hypothetical protein